LDCNVNDRISEEF